MRDQIFLQGENKYLELMELLEKKGVHKLFIVCGRNSQQLYAFKYLVNMCNKKNIVCFIYDEFESNPKYESIKKGMDCFKNRECDAIMAVGGGSAIDVAKCMKIFLSMADKEEFIYQKTESSIITFIALPTTAGTGAESTQFAVMYYQGDKYSVNNICGLPDIVVLEPLVLKKLPTYQRIVTSLDALAHGIESYWSINSTSESRELSKKVIKGFFQDYRGYVDNDDKKNARMQILANLAGRAINMARTTAAHAMSYKLSSEYNIAHGHAVGLCLPVLLKYMLEHLDQCCDTRGREYVKAIFDEIADAAGCASVDEFIIRLERLIIVEFQLSIPRLEGEEKLYQLCQSVNMERLKNNPVKLLESDLGKLYKQILDEKRRGK